MMNRILIVDDDENGRNAMRGFFEAYGFEVQSAGCADEAITLGQDFIPDVLISDWMLGPDGDGIDVAKTLLHTHCPRLAVIVMSGHRTEAVQEVAKAQGVPVQIFMRKPLSLFELKSAVDLVLQH